MCVLIERLGVRKKYSVMSDESGLSNRMSKRENVKSGAFERAVWIRLLQFALPTHRPGLCLGENQARATCTNLACHMASCGDADI